MARVFCWRRENGSRIHGFATTAVPLRFRHPKSDRCCFFTLAAICDLPSLRPFSRHPTALSLVGSVSFDLSSSLLLFSHSFVLLALILLLATEHLHHRNRVRVTSQTCRGILNTLLHVMFPSPRPISQSGQRLLACSLGRLLDTGCRLSGLSNFESSGGTLPALVFAVRLPRP